MVLYSLDQARAAPEIVAILKVRRWSKPFYFLLIVAYEEIMVM